MRTKTLKVGDGFQAGVITVYIRKISGKTVRLSIDAPEDMEIKPRKALDRRATPAVK